MEVGCIQCTMLGQLKDPGHPWMNRVCTRLPVFSSIIIVRRSPTLEGATAWEPWVMFPYPLPMGAALVAALSCNQWKAHHKFPHTRGLICYTIQYNTIAHSGTSVWCLLQHLLIEIDNQYTWIIIELNAKLNFYPFQNPPWCHGTVVASLFGVLVLRFQTGFPAMCCVPSNCSMIFKSLGLAHSFLTA